MAKSTYISTNLNEEQLTLVKYLEDYEILYFRISDLAEQVPKTLSNMIISLKPPQAFQSKLPRLLTGGSVGG